MHLGSERLMHVNINVMRGNYEREENKNIQTIYNNVLFTLFNYNTYFNLVFYYKNSLIYSIVGNWFTLKDKHLHSKRSRGKLLVVRTWEGDNEDNIRITIAQFSEFIYIII